ncbi:hypothetical protein Tco_1445505 [Tanacetum coccineum]
MESCENDRAAIVVIGTTDNVKTLVKDIKDGFDMLVHLGKPDMVRNSLLETATGVCSWVAFKDVTKTLKDTKYGISMLEEKDATGKEDGTIVG